VYNATIVITVILIWIYRTAHTEGAGVIEQ